jgi:nucleoside diphosphate kinase
MITLVNELENNNLLPIVYSPDVFASDIQGDLDHFISENTGFTPVYRQWFSHTKNTIEQFYSDNVQKTIPNWYLVSDLFMAGPVLITLWNGDNVYDKFSRIKGKSHPAKAEGHTIRGNFWCDNPICNLIHSSDNPTEAEKELKILNVFEKLNTVDKKNLPLFIKTNTHALQAQHSSIIILYKILVRYLSTQTSTKLKYIDFPSGSAFYTYKTLRLEFGKLSDKNNQMHDIIKLYFSGNKEVLGKINELIPLTQWERYIITCGLATINGWEFD